MGHYSNPTENRAIGAVEKEFNMMRKRAEQIRRRRRMGLLTPEEEALVRRQFIGIYRRLLREALED